jgi:hypothetical protein
MWAAAPGPVVKAAFIAKADELCKAEKAEVAAIPQPKKRGDLYAYLDDNVDIASKLIAGLHNLPAPTLDKDKLTAFLDAYDHLLAAAQHARNAAALGSPDLDSLLNEAVAAGHAADAAAEAYGSKQCQATPT